MHAADSQKRRWPDGAIVYHIYPRSFQDTDGDGIGDLPGITKQLDYLMSLGVNAIWLSPFYPSPMADFGYDISDYCNVDPLFGTFNDFTELLAAAHNRDIKVMIDLVPNHTSDDHAWFQESASSRDNPKADWYVWRDAVGYGTGATPLPPNNWRDVLTGRSAWQWHEGRRQFYLHSFHTRQPDLNWTNPAVRAAFMDVMRFWLDQGVDGFRVDAVDWLAKEPLLRDDDIRPSYVPGKESPYKELEHNNSCGWPAAFAYLSQMCNVLKEKAYSDRARFMVTEAYPERRGTLAAYLQFYVGMDPAVAAPFNFEGVERAWQAKSWRRFLRGFYTALNQFDPLCVASNAFGNHDQPRLASRIGAEAARSAAVLLMTLPGMAFVYYGEELGMQDVEIPAEYIHDPAAIASPEHGTGRDPERTPMQWSVDDHAGFTTGDQTWLPVATDYATRNVEVESADPLSTLSLYRALGRMRNSAGALQRGQVQVVDCSNIEVVGYVCSYPGEVSYVVCINFSGEPAPCRVPVDLESFVISSSSSPEPRSSTTDISPDSNLTLLPYEAVVYTARNTEMASS